MEKSLISIIIPAYNARYTIGKTLSSLRQQEYKGKKEILVVNSSQDGTKNYIHHNFSEVQVVQHPRRVYTGEAKNIGLKRAQGEVIAFIDSDCIASPQWLSTAAQRYEQGYPVVGGSIGNTNFSKIVSKAEYFLELIQLSPGSRARFVNLISTANCFFSRKIFDKYGSFPSIRKGVDMIFSHYLIKQGEKILFDPQMKVSHACTSNFSRYIQKQILHGEYSMVTRRQAKLPGAFLSKNFIFVPFLPVIRSISVVKHILSLEMGLMKDFLLTLPIFMAGNLAWSYGFGKGMLKNE